MKARLTFCGPDNASQGFALDETLIQLSETGELSIGGIGPDGTVWAVSFPVELLATMEAKDGRLAA